MSDLDYDDVVALFHHDDAHGELPDGVARAEFDAALKRHADELRVVTVGVGDRDAFAPPTADPWVHRLVNDPVPATSAGAQAAVTFETTLCIFTGGHGLFATTGTATFDAPFGAALSGYYVADDEGLLWTGRLSTPWRGVVPTGMPVTLTGGVSVVVG